MFAGWGRFVYRYRWATLVGSGVLLAISIVLLMKGGTLTSGSPPTSNLQSARAGNLVANELGAAKVTSNFNLIFQSDTLSVSDPQYQAALADALAPIQGDPRILKMVTPYNAPDPRVAQAFTSKDGHEALVSIDLRSSGQQAWKDYDDLRAKVKSSSLIVTGTQDAESMASAVVAGLGGSRPLASSLQEHWGRRDAAVGEMYDMTMRLASYRPPGVAERLVLRSLPGRQAEVNRFLGVFAGTVRPNEFFSPPNLIRLLGYRIAAALGAVPDRPRHRPSAPVESAGSNAAQK
jgi:hypothetical protein